ncbi:MAG TPA: RNA 2',3'-cyclic phosphodiesterase [Vicinamibacterales bacterium]|jgi:2'-5' RNA ligase
MRLFVAVELSQDARAAASDTAERLRRALGRTIDARWIDAAQMHLTVRFIGEVEDARAQDLIGALSAPMHLPPFQLVLCRCGAFPMSGAPRVIWIGLSDGRDSLARLHRALDLRLQPFGFASDDRPFRAHLTVARVKRVSGRPAAIREKLDGIPVPPAASRIDRAVIFRSHLSPDGARYDALASVPLA